MSGFFEVMEVPVILASVAVLIHLLMPRIQPAKQEPVHLARSSPRRLRASNSRKSWTSSSASSIRSTSSGSLSPVQETKSRKISVSSAMSSVVADASERKAAFDAHLSTMSMDEDETRNYVLLRHLPNKITEVVLRENVSAITSNFVDVTLPMDLEKGFNKGYAFVRFCTPQDALAFIDAAQGMTFAGIAVDGIPIRSRKALEVGFAKPK